MKEVIKKQIIQIFKISITQQISNNINVITLQIIITQEPFIIKYFEIEAENLSVLLNDNDKNKYESNVIIIKQKEHIITKIICVFPQQGNFSLK